MNHMPRIDRRSFLVGSAVAGLSLGFHVPFAPSAGAQDAPEINAWVVIEPDDTVIIRIARSEMGQGTLTGLAQMVAEELECDWSKVTTEYPTPGQSIARKNPWGDFGTGGSRGIRSSQDYVRKGGAAARIMLIAAAANEWKVPASECTAANSVITHKPSNRSTTYGKVAAAAALIEPPKDVQLKDPKDWKIIGKSVKRLDTRDKTTGKMIYGIDVKLPGMLNATIKACPVFGARTARSPHANVHPFAFELDDEAVTRQVVTHLADEACRVAGAGRRTRRRSPRSRLAGGTPGRAYRSRARSGRRATRRRRRPGHRARRAQRQSCRCPAPGAATWPSGAAPAPPGSRRDGTGAG